MGGEILVAEGRDTAGLNRGIGGVGSCGAGRPEGDGGTGWVGKGEVWRFFYGESVWGPTRHPQVLILWEKFQVLQMLI